MSKKQGDTWVYLLLGYFPIREPLKCNLPTTFCYNLDEITKKRIELMKCWYIFLQTKQFEFKIFFHLLPIWHF